MQFNGNFLSTGAKRNATENIVKRRGRLLNVPIQETDENIHGMEITVKYR